MLESYKVKKDLFIADKGVGSPDRFTLVERGANTPQGDCTFLELKKDEEYLAPKRTELGNFLLKNQLLKKNR
jgi:hypothetical protein